MNLNKWMWKWHFISGLIALPLVLLLSITGGIYLFKDTVEHSEFKPLKEVEAVGRPLSYQDQWQIAKKEAVKRPTKMVIPSQEVQATEFISGMRGDKSTLFVDPYSQTVTGEVVLKDTWMYDIRKLHGELLMGKFGTLFIELTACWMFMLIITGFYIWWPKTSWRLRGYFTIRTDVKRRLVWRDIHAVTSMWISILVLITLAGGMPWTEVWGSGYKSVQKYTHSGYPQTWKSRGLTSHATDHEAITLDEMVVKAKALNLPGQVSIGLPKNKKGVYTVSNTYKDKGQHRVLHYDQYSGEVVKQHDWSDVGIMMRGRQWVMSFHEGLLGSWNWWLMLIMTILLTLTSGAALAAWLLRKKKGKWGTPKVPEQYSIGKGLFSIIIFLGLFFPLFGASLLLIWLYERYIAAPSTV